MITAYTYVGHHSASHAVAAEGALPPGTVWLDLLDPTPEELKFIDRIAHVRIPKLQDVRILEQSRQAYLDRGVAYMLTPTVAGSKGGNPESGVMLFILTKTHMLTVHRSHSRSIGNFAGEVRRRPKEIENPGVALLGVFEAVVARCADVGEVISHEMEEVSRIVFQESLQRSKAPGRGQANSWRKVLAGLGHTARLNHKLRSTLAGMERLLIFLASPGCGLVGEAADARLKPMLRDIDGLTHHVDYMISESNFLLDAIVGAISIEQNNVIKIFSVVTITLMPPTLIAGIFGMNFDFMPELRWLLGYPYALVLMIASAIIPLWLFRRKGWL